MFWEVPKIWKGGEVWIIGGGPSMPKQFNVPESIIEAVAGGETHMSAMSSYLSAIHNKHVIGINHAFKLGTWVDVMFFGDPQFLDKVPQELARFPNLKITCKHGPKTKKYYRRKVKFLDRHHNTVGISDTPDAVCWNNNSGAAAISIAANMGAKRIILLGFDMHSPDDRSHWHFEYKGKHVNDKAHIRHMKGWQQIALDAEDRGIELLNASPISSIKEIKKAQVKDLL